VAKFMQTHGISTTPDLIKKSVEDISWFWDAAMKDLNLFWQTPYTQVMDDSRGFPWTQWFLNGKINITENCIDRHLKPLSDKPAVIWEGEDESIRTLSYRDLSDLTNQVANALTTLGISKGDHVGITLPMLPETVAVLFGCFKIGAIALPIFSGFGPKAVSFRLNAAKSKVLFTTDITTRRKKPVDILTLARQAQSETPCLEKIIVINRNKTELKSNELDWDDCVLTQSLLCDVSPTDAEDPCLVIYTSGTTGKPKGTIHTHAGCLAQIGKEHKYAFDVHVGDVFYWFTDVGWMMGPWEMIGALMHGATLMLTEGTPDTPNPDRLWKIIEKHKVRTFGISPTAIRMLMKTDPKWIDQHDMPSLELLGSTGEPWDPASYAWFFEKVGKKRCPIINISGGTEIIGCLLSPLPTMPLKACSLGGPALGMDVDIFNETGKPERNGIGYLVCKQPGPSMTKGFLGEPERYIETYFGKWPNIWNHGDWAHVDEDGQWFLHGRSDDTVNIAGKRVGPAEFESALMTHPSVTEAATIGVPDKMKGETVVCFVVLKNDPTPDLASELEKSIVDHMGKSLKPKEIRIVSALPKTRSGKIVRGAIKKTYLGEPVTDVSSIENPDVLVEYNA
jgi:acetyl-CoA synthetase